MKMTWFSFVTTLDQPYGSAYQGLVFGWNSWLWKETISTRLSPRRQLNASVEEYFQRRNSIQTVRQSIYLEDELRNDGEKAEYSSLETLLIKLRRVLDKGFVQESEMLRT